MERDECFRRQLAEVEALASIFCAPGEITFNSAHISALRAVLESNNLPFDLSNSTQIVIHRALQLEVNTAKVSVSFSLPQTYPLSADPHIRVTCSGFLKDSSERIELLLREHARSREPKAECIFDLVSEVDNFLSTLSSTTTNLPTKKMPLSTTRTDNTVNNSNNNDDEANARQQEACLIWLDHMRNKPQYIKILTRWAQDFSLIGAVVCVEPPHSKSQYFIVLIGLSSNIDSFLLSLRTQVVDVDSRNRKCKERTTRVLWRGTPHNVQSHQCNNDSAFDTLGRNNNFQFVKVEVESTQKAREWMTHACGLPLDIQLVPHL